MSTSSPFQFWPPANQVDFPNDRVKQALLVKQWNTNLDGFTRQGIAGNPWNTTNAANITNYFNPVVTPIPPDAIVQEILWGAFPGRIGYYFPQLDQNEQLSLGDTGYMTDGKSFPPITTNPCTGGGADPKPYGPYGPRGWQDEYCEWAVTRNARGKITRIDFTCENPEYWNSLWMIDPEQVLALYRQTLNKPQIQLTDLYLSDQGGNPVIDHHTQKPVYNPLNKWNLGPLSTAQNGGAMHLTSTPNTLQTEIGLATAATIQRTSGNNDPNVLICCAQYGQPQRNSDPNIGQSVNKIVGLGNTATLTNPPGLYIQIPDFSGYKTPDNRDPSAFWTIVRGRETLKDSNGNLLPGNFILHAVYEVPESLGYTVSDITIDQKPILWAGQVAETINMHIIATAFKKAVPTVQDCAGDADKPFAQPLQLFYADIFSAMAAKKVPNPVGQPMAVISNSTLIAPIVDAGSTVEMVLTAATTTADPKNPASWPSVTFDVANIAASVKKVEEITYAVPGNSYPSPAMALFLEVTVRQNAAKGLNGIFVTNPGQRPSVAMPALINII